MTHLTVEDLKTIRLVLKTVKLDKKLNEAIDNLDLELLSHGLKCEAKIKPRRPYQRGNEYEYKFIQVA